MNHCIATIEEVTPAWLTEILTRSGRLSCDTLAWHTWMISCEKNSQQVFSSG
ncbi:hypothetical protein KDA_40320 [Dictyobacter alpinus]|uniref:Uncharacterized protein n=1 Tax=Dictyobacter alpinus TaxID=2014873 RepID=A0A402BAU4_9CHLR|nr:hypothetical protein KDA_40320 [Dictyobacter alpinus]